MSAHYWAPTVLSPDGKPFDKKLIKVLLGLPTVNVLIIGFLYEDKLLVYLGAENVKSLLLHHISHVSRDHRQVRDLAEATCFLNDGTKRPHCHYVLSLYILKCHALLYQTLVSVFHCTGCLSESH